MPRLVINHNKINADTAKQLTELCPFSAIVYENEKLEIDAGCKMCGLCVKKGPNGAITLEEDNKKDFNKAAWRGIAVFAELQDGKIHKISLELAGKAKELAAVTGEPVYAVIIGRGLCAAAESLLRYGIDKVYVYDYEELEHFLMQPYANAFSDFIEKIKPSSILVGATNLGRSLAPRVAARFRTGLTADCTMLEIKQNSDLVQIRPAFGGNIMAQIVTPNSRPQLCTVRYKIFSAPQPQESSGGEIINMRLEKEQLHSESKLLSISQKPKETDISEAEIIVAAGRGIKTKADLALAQALAEALNAQLACTRPLVENGWFDAKRQIGLSGRTVNAKLIITLGISGAVQFAAGMKSSACIVAVNQDPKAPIFDIAHYGLTGDLYEIVPQLLKAVKAESEEKA